MWHEGVNVKVFDDFFLYLCGEVALGEVVDYVYFLPGEEKGGFLVDFAEELVVGGLVSVCVVGTEVFRGWEEVAVVSADEPLRMRRVRLRVEVFGQFFSDVEFEVELEEDGAEEVVAFEAGGVRE